MTNEVGHAKTDLAEACPRCGVTSTGRYCSGCGFTLGFVAEARTVVPETTTPSTRRLSVPLPGWKSVLLVASGATATLVLLGTVQLVSGGDDRDAIDTCKNNIATDPSNGELGEFKVVTNVDGRKRVVGVGSPPTDGFGTAWVYICSMGNDGVLYHGSGLSE